jgi:FkbM family methyltransferase
MIRSPKKLFQDAAHFLGYEFFRSRPYGVRELRDVAAIYGDRQLRTIIDAGANQGDMAREFAREFPDATIYSFEPFPETYERLVETCARFPRIKPMKEALGAVEAIQPLFLTQYSLTHSLLPTADEAVKYLGSAVAPVGQHDVRTTTLDAFAESMAIQRIDLLKLDVQGYELKVLEGAKRLLDQRRISLVFSELNFVPLYKDQACFHEVYECLIEAGFGLVGLYGQNYRPGPALSWCDGLFVNNAALRDSRP